MSNATICSELRKEHFSTAVAELNKVLSKKALGFGFWNIFFFFFLSNDFQDINKTPEIQIQICDVINTATVLDRPILFFSFKVNRSVIYLVRFIWF